MDNSVHYIIEGILAVGGFMVGLIVKRAYHSIDELWKKHDEMTEKLTNMAIDLPKNYVTKNVKQFKIIPDKEVGNLIIQVGKSNVMFSSHMDTVQRTARKTNDLYITEDNYVYAAYPKQKRTYLDNKKEAIEQFEMEKEAEEI